MQVIVKDRQSLLDIALQTLGGIAGVFAIAERNGLSITSRLQDGQVLEWELSDTVDAKIQNVYAQRGIFPATDISARDTGVLITATNAGSGEFKRPNLREWITEIEDGTISWQTGNIDAGLGSRLEEDSDLVEVNTVRRIKEKLASGETPVSESGQTLARIFTNQFNDVFA